MPEQPKPNRRRAVVVTTVFALVLGCIFYYLWRNHAYLKWRFVGSEPGLMSHALETGYITPEQVVTLVNSGATFEVRVSALRTLCVSEKFEVPYDDRVVESISTFAANLPEDPMGVCSVASLLAIVVSRSERPELLGVLEPLSAHPVVFVRRAVLSAFRGEWSLGEKGRAILSRLASDQDSHVRGEVADALVAGPGPEWAVDILRGLLHDADAQVRCSAVFAVASFRQADGTNPFAARVREILDSPDEDGEVRAAALCFLFHKGHLGDNELATLANNHQKRVAETAKLLTKWRAEVSEEARQKSSVQE